MVLYHIKVLNWTKIKAAEKENFSDVTLAFIIRRVKQMS